MHRTNTIVIGAGQAGLAVSHHLRQWGIDHVVFERGRIAQRWRTERWDSLQLLTPNWQSRLPGYAYMGPNPHGYMNMAEVISYLSTYATLSQAPVQEFTSVWSVTRDSAGYLVQTNRGPWRAASVVIATGYCDVPHKPRFAGALSPDVVQLSPSQYRRPGALPDGGVLVVGASASGAQIADELAQSGRSVTLAVGKHIRVPRTYRGRDIMWWLDVAGILGESAADIPELARARRQPSLQLVGRNDRRSLDLGILAERGVEFVGRAADADGDAMAFVDNLQANTRAADDRLRRILDRLDAYADQWGIGDELPPASRPQPLNLSAGASRIDLRDRGIRTVIWATGYKRNYSWLDVPVLDGRGEIIHRGGVTPAAGLYVLGLPVLRTRRSTYIDGVGADAAYVANHISSRLAGRYAHAA